MTAPGRQRRSVIRPSAQADVGTGPNLAFSATSPVRLKKVAALFQPLFPVHRLKIDTDWPYDFGGKIHRRGKKMRMAQNEPSSICLHLYGPGRTQCRIGGDSLK